MVVTFGDLVGEREESLGTVEFVVDVAAAAAVDEAVVAAVGDVADEDAFVGRVAGVEER